MEGFITTGRDFFRAFQAYAGCICVATDAASVSDRHYLTIAKWNDFRDSAICCIMYFDPRGRCGVLAEQLAVAAWDFVDRTTESQIMWREHWCAQGRRRWICLRGFINGNETDSHALFSER
jgi:hypothetical protein